MPRNKSKVRIPAVWSKYSVSGRPLENTRLVAFKSPMAVKRLTPEALVQHMSKSKIKLGLVIDLTDTQKYYDSNEFIALNVVYLKLRCPGMGIPPEEIVCYCHMIIERYFMQHEKDNTLVGIHCLNGVNRAGYLICRYLIDKLLWDPVKAIRVFEEARGHLIEHDFIREDLLQRKPLVQRDQPKKCILM